MKSVTEKFNTVVQNNTYFFFNKDFESSYEGVVNSLRSTLLLIHEKLKQVGNNEAEIKRIYESILAEKENGLVALLSLTGLSNEYFKRLTTIIRITNNPELNKLILKDKWGIPEKTKEIKEWTDSQIIRHLKNSEFFRKGLINLFYEGESINFLVKTLPYFELRKLSSAKLKFNIPDLVDTLVRYGVKGRYTGKKENNPETLIVKILEERKIPFEAGKLDNVSRKMDFIIPNRKQPKIIIECSYVATTSSGLNDKADRERDIGRQIKKFYPKSIFVGFVDGVGWMVRQEALSIMAEAFEDVYTFNETQLDRFKNLLDNIFKK